MPQPFRGFGASIKPGVLHNCGGNPTINTSKKANVITLTGATLPNGATCDFLVELDNAQFGTSAGHDAMITGSWSASATDGTTQYSAGPTGRLAIHIY